MFLFVYESIENGHSRLGYDFVSACDVDDAFRAFYKKHGHAKSVDDEFFYEIISNLSIDGKVNLFDALTPDCIHLLTVYGGLNPIFNRVREE